MCAVSLFRPYHYGEYKWDKYLLDVQDCFSRNTQASLNLADESVAELRQQNANLAQIRNTLEGGFEQMRAEFNWGFTLMIDRMDHQITFLSQIAERLDAIHRTLQSPLMTQARELFHLGQERFRKGLWDKALDTFMKAEEKNEVDFLLQLQMGKLLLYGRNKDNNVVNPDEAEKHLVLAARFVQAEKDSLSEWDRFCGEAHFHIAVAEYLIGEQKQKEGLTAARNEHLKKALEHLVRAVALRPGFTEIINLQAKCHCLLEQRNEALEKLEILSDRDRRYYAKSKLDHDFDSVHPEIEVVFQRCLTRPGTLARNTQKRLEEACELLIWAKQSNETSTRYAKELHEIDERLELAKQALSSLDVDLESLHSQLPGIRQRLVYLIEDAINTRKNSLAAEISSTEGRQGSNESSVVNLVQQMNATKGTGMAWLFVFIFAIAYQVGLPILLSPWKQKLETTRLTGAGLFLMTVVFLGWLTLGYQIGKNISRSRKNQPLKLQMQECEKTVEECKGVLPTLRMQLDQAKLEIQQFSDWRARRTASDAHN